MVFLSALCKSPVSQRRLHVAAKRVDAKVGAIEQAVDRVMERHGCNCFIADDPAQMVREHGLTVIEGGRHVPVSH